MMTTMIQEERNPGASTSHDGPDDRISELPKEILHHILGFLEMDEFLIGTSLVSTKWRNLWKSVSTLNFPNCYICMRNLLLTPPGIIVDNGDGGGGTTIRNNEKKYQNFVDHVLRLRDSQTSKIQIFRYQCLSFLIGYDYLEHLHNFILSAVVNQGAQEIQISTACRYSGRRPRDANNNMIIHFNPSIFTSGELRKFAFKLLLINNRFLIQFLRSMCRATQLTHLTLYGIILPGGDDDDDDSNAAELHLVCPVLDTLVLHCCSSKHLKVIDISAPRLNSLSICNTGMRDGPFDDYLGGCRLEIHTPNLTSFNYSGCVFVDCFTENLPAITIANLTI